MGDRVETRISKVLNGGPEAVQKHVMDGKSLELFVWMGLIFLKTHLKDRDLRVTPDLRQPDEKIADSYDWQTLHHVHSVVRCFVNGATVERGVFGSFAVFAAKTQGTPDQFDFADLYHAQTMLLRMGEVALVTTFNDSCGAIQGAMPRLERIEGPLSEIQAREVMVDFAFLALHLKERPKFFTECDTLKEEVVEKAILPSEFELVELDYSIRGALFRDALGPYIGTLRESGKNFAEIEAAIDSGHFTVLFDASGKFIKESIVPFSARVSDQLK